jgi:hypothetical protein
MKTFSWRKARLKTAQLVKNIPNKSELWKTPVSVWLQ